MGLLSRLYQVTAATTVLRMKAMTTLRMTSTTVAKAMTAGAWILIQVVSSLLLLFVPIDTPLTHLTCSNQEMSIFFTRTILIASKHIDKRRVLIHLYAQHILFEILLEMELMERVLR